MKKIIRMTIKFISAPVVIPFFLVYGHFIWLFDDEIPYSWVWEIPFCDYLLEKPL